VATVSLEWFRDLVIVIWGLAATIAVIIIVVLALAAYFKVRPIINSVKSVASTVEYIASCVEEAAGPLAQVVALVQGFRTAFGVVKKSRR